MTTQPAVPEHAAPHSAHDVAQAVAQTMWPRDQATNALGMELVSVAPGRATLSMRVRPDMLNGHQTCHGGLIFTLADSAFAYACNSHNHSTVASACHIDFLAPARVGDLLEAEAVEQALAGRSGVYDVTVRVPGAQTVALFRGKSRRINGQPVPGLTPTQP